MMECQHDLCFSPASAVYRRKDGKEISVCDEHAPNYIHHADFVRLV